MGAELLVIVLSLLAIAMTLTKLIGFITAGTSFLSGEKSTRSSKSAQELTIILIYNA